MVTSLAHRDDTRLQRERAADRAAIQVAEVWRSFRKRQALAGVSLEMRPGEIRALLGPNGAGKTTLVRILLGTVAPDRGAIRLFGRPPDQLAHREMANLVGWIPSGDRTFYLRISGRENLSFIARLHGMSRRESLEGADRVLDAVGLSEAASVRVDGYSHGMQKRLSIARALLTDPPILLVDEATHDLDPVGARKVQELVSQQAQRGTSVLWATQRVDEIRGFADTVTVLNRGQVRFTGTVPEFLSHAQTRAYLVRLQDGLRSGDLLDVARVALGDMASLEPSHETGKDDYVLYVSDRFVLGDALGALMAAGIRVLNCTDRRSGAEDAFLRLAGEL